MEFESVKDFFQKKYGKEISNKEFLEKLKKIIEDIDLLIDVAEVTRDLVKKILGRIENSIVNNKSCKISIEERKIAIKLLTKLSKVVLSNEDEKRYIEALSNVFIDSLNKIQKNNKSF